MYIRITLFVLIFMASQASLLAQQDGLMAVMEEEMAREWAQYQKATQPPYYIAWRVNDMQTANVRSSFGSMTGSNSNRSRALATEIKVGDYSFDNSHPVDSYDGMDVPYGEGGMRGGGMGELPLDNRAEAIKLILWDQTQAAYRESLSVYKAIRNSPGARKSTIPDFSREQPKKFVEEQPVEFDKFYDAALWQEKIARYSAPFLSNTDIVDGDASLQIGVERKYFISSEGARVVQNRTFAYVTIRGSIRAVDGDIVPLHLSYFAFDPAQLPNDDVILKDVDAMIEKLKILKSAPVAEPYTGPAILQARAAGVFFHEIFGHRVEGHRLKNIHDGQTFKAKVNEQVLPSTLSVVFDPTIREFKGQALNGFYRYDDEGIAGQKVNVVEKGVLKTFLMSRTPIERFEQSNGHGRADAGAEAVSRQSNLIIENSKEVSMSDLRKMLIKECRKQKKRYGYLFMDVVGGFTTTDRFMPNAFNIFPTEVYRVYVDGRPDELVRGVDLIGTPLAMFAEIKAADDHSEVFTGFCGAESGSIPVTAISPSLFVKRIETQKKPVAQVEDALLPRPGEK